MPSKSPFSDAERASGATFQSYGGLELPEKYLDPMAEYEAARTAAGLFDLSFRARLRFTGPDRASFLHNMLSNDVQRLRPGGGCYATLLTQQSKVVADANVFCTEDALLFDVDVRCKDRARSHLEQHLVADEVEIEDRSAAETTLGVHGRRAPEALASAAKVEALPGGDYDHATVEISGVPVRVARVCRTGEAGFDVMIPREQAAAVWRGVFEAGRPLGMHPAGMIAFNVLRVEAGIAWFGVDVDESHLVLEAALERAVSFTKGCYLGQEVVERTSARGHVNRKLVGLRLQGRPVPRAGAKIFQGDSEVGQVTSAVFSPAAGSAIVMGYVRREAMEPGSRVEIDTASGRQPGEIVAMPFFRRA